LKGFLKSKTMAGANLQCFRPDDGHHQAQATRGALAAMGMSVSDGAYFFTYQVVIDQAFPLELKAGNPQGKW
jgi:antitoxin component of RelBE/YafQ-DinJ toxin-antitoxin module